MSSKFSHWVECKMHGESGSHTHTHTHRAAEQWWTMYWWSWSTWAGETALWSFHSAMSYSPTHSVFPQLLSLLTLYSLSSAEEYPPNFIWHPIISSLQHFCRLLYLVQWNNLHPKDNYLVKFYPISVLFLALMVSCIMGVTPHMSSHVPGTGIFHGSRTLIPAKFIRPTYHVDDETLAVRMARWV